MDDFVTGSKRSADTKNEEEEEVKKAKISGDFNMELRVLLPDLEGGAVIGKSGENIKSLRKKYDAKVFLRDSTFPERVLVIIAPLSRAMGALKDSLKYIDHKENRRSLKLLIHESQAGAVIGKGGQKIKQLRKQCNCEIIVYSDSLPQSTERVVQLTAKPETIINTAKIIMTMMKDVPPLGPYKYYNPENYNPSMVESYGGYRENESFSYKYKNNTNSSNFSLNRPMGGTRNRGVSKGRRGQPGPQWNNKNNNNYNRMPPSRFNHPPPPPRYNHPPPRPLPLNHQRSRPPPPPHMRQGPRPNVRSGNWPGSRASFNPPPPPRRPPNIIRSQPNDVNSFNVNRNNYNNQSFNSCYDNYSSFEDDYNNNCDDTSHHNDYDNDNYYDDSHNNYDNDSYYDDSQQNYNQIDNYYDNYNYLDNYNCHVDNFNYGDNYNDNENMNFNDNYYQGGNNYYNDENYFYDYNQNNISQNASENQPHNNNNEVTNETKNNNNSNLDVIDERPQTESFDENYSNNNFNENDTNRDNSKININQIDTNNNNNNKININMNKTNSDKKVEIKNVIHSSTARIPKELTGSVIGEYAYKLDEMRMESGAEIKLVDQSEDSSEKNITIEGSDTQVQKAQNLLQIWMKTYSDQKNKTSV